VTYPRFPWALAASLALVTALGLAAWHSVGLIRQDERRRVLAEGTALTSLQLQAERSQWARERDSLAALVAQVDTVVRVRIRQVRDTLWLPADTSVSVRYAACRATLDALATDCDRYRETTTAALQNAAAIQRTDSLAKEALTARAIALRDSLQHAQRETSRRPTWRLLGLTAGLTWLATYIR
jgi:hypothetical protein